MKVITVGDIARSMGAKAAAMGHHLSASHRQARSDLMSTSQQQAEELALRPKRISRGARARAARPEVRRMLPACVIKSMRRIKARRADGRWDGIVR